MKVHEVIQDCLVLKSAYTSDDIRMSLSTLCDIITVSSILMNTQRNYWITSIQCEYKFELMADTYDENLALILMSILLLEW